MVALAIVGALVLIGVIGVIVAVFLVSREAADRIDTAIEQAEEGDIPDILGGECFEVQIAFTSFLTPTFLMGDIDEADRRAYEQAVAELQSKVPDEIRDDFEVLSDAYAEALEIYLEVGIPAPGDTIDQDRIDEAEALLEAPEVEQARDNINQWLEENCT